MRATIDADALPSCLLDDRRLSPHATSILDDDDNRLLVSSASADEISLKSRLVPPESLSSFVPDRLAAGRLTPLGIEANHALRAGELVGQYEVETIR